MDPKMLLGCLSTASYATPVVSALERNARFVPIPADPSFGLRVNLVDTRLYERRAELVVGDDALLQSVVTGRTDPATVAANITGADAQRRGSQKPGALPPARRQAQQTAPWMRRMGYDEYHVGTGYAKAAARAADSAQKPKLNPKLQNEKRRKAMLQSFEAAKRRPVHPDRRKAHLRPVSVVPVLPDLFTAGQDFIIMEFERDVVLTHEDRAKEESEATAEARRSTASISLADGNKKFLACFTPSDDTLVARKRAREVEEGDEVSQAESENRPTKFVKEETYEWVREFAIREGQVGASAGNGLSARKSGAPTRSCFALTEHVVDDGDKKLITMSRIETSWKLTRRPTTLPQLGHPLLKLERQETDPDDEVEALELKRSLFAGSGKNVQAERQHRDRMARLLEED